MEKKQKIKEIMVTKQGEGEAPGQECGLLLTVSHTLEITRYKCRIIDAFELWCWRRLLRVPWTARRSNQSILKETSPGVHWKD